MKSKFSVRNQNPDIAFKLSRFNKLFRCYKAGSQDSVTTLNLLILVIVQKCSLKTYFEIEMYGISPTRVMIKFPP